MEEDQKNLNVDDKKLDLKNLLISKPDEDVNDEASSSNEDKKRNEEDSKECLPSTKEETMKVSTLPPRTPTPPARSSPEPSCAICLEQLTNKSFTNSCFHMFCFTCLVEWSKVKPVCPLCKQSFTSIVHNVRSFQEYDQYHINRSKTPESWLYDRRFRYATTMTNERVYNRNRTDYSNIIESEIASHRMRFAPHAVRLRAYSPHMARRIATPCVYRRRIYDENLWVRPATGDRVRYASPTFFQRNIACTHRLLPWLNRELFAVMPNNESQISFVIELIMALIVKYNITSQEFFTHIEPYTGPHTSHFIHEFYNFAVSPYDMENYDFHAQYSSIPFEVRAASSPDSDVIPIPTNETSPRKSSSTESKRKKKHHSKKKMQLDNFRRHWAKIVLKRNSKNNCWETVDNSAPLLNYSEVSSTNPYEIPGPSTRNPTAFHDCSPEVSSQDLEKSNEVECIQDDECQIIEVLKPKHERTPEVISLSSDDETTRIIDVSSSVENECVPSTSLIEVLSDSPVSSSDEDIVFICETQGKQEEDTSNETSDKPIDYSLKTTDKNTEDKSCYEDTEPASSNSTDNAESESLHAKKNLQSAVHVVSQDDACSSSWSPLAKPKKRKAAILDDSSTESCSESAQVSELECRIKKLKLRSVVAHFSYDPSDERNDSAHHSSSHKRSKERKKKKKKHKRRHRVYSSDTA